jgi:hypothetical protein
MFILVLIVFFVLVMTIAVITAKLNAKPPCDHDWHEVDGDLRCFKCNRMISGGHGNPDSTVRPDTVTEGDEMSRFA